MALYHCKLTFTGHLEYRTRPEEKQFCVRAPTLDKAAKRVVKYAKTKWPYYRFEATLLDIDKVLK